VGAAEEVLTGEAPPGGLEASGVEGVVEAGWDPSVDNHGRLATREAIDRDGEAISVGDDAGVSGDGARHRQ
jgi:hypothetical protein